MPRVLIVATDGFEEWELFGPREILQKRGAEVVLASPKLDPIQATVHDDPGKTIRPDLTLDEANADDFDALILPGGVRNPDHLRMNAKAIALIKRFAGRASRSARSATGRGCWSKPTCCAAARRRAGRRSAPTSGTPARNVVDEPAVTDGNIVTSRNPHDVEAFTNALIDLIENAPEVSEIRQPSELPPRSFRV